ncbi:MAG TPA: hypothetical protein VFV66_36115 [Nonomuraea sp.]|nr:hypothetical protein [Nonomuraea sp.]
MALALPRFPVQALEKDIRARIASWNEDPKPYVWVKTVEEILDALAAFLSTNC